MMTIITMTTMTTMTKEFFPFISFVFAKRSGRTDGQTDASKNQSRLRIINGQHYPCPALSVDAWPIKKSIYSVNYQKTILFYILVRSLLKMIVQVKINRKMEKNMISNKITKFQFVPSPKSRKYLSLHRKYKNSKNKNKALW